jgi:PAS domain S-box-containing protein
MKASKEIETDREARFFSLSLDLLGVASLDGYFTYLNSAWEATLGYKPAELTSQPFVNFVHPEDVAATQAELENLATGTPLIYFENRYRCQDGAWKWLAWKAVLDTKTQEIYAIARDITQTKQLEAERLELLQREQAALKETEERWQLAVRGSNDGIWDWNVKTNKVFFSTRWKEMLGYEEDEIADSVEEWSSRVHPDDLDWVMAVITAHFDKKTPFYISEHRLRCKDGSYKWILDRGQALWDKDGNVVRMAGSHTDITDRKLAERELAKQHKRSQLFADIALKIRQSLQLEEIIQTTVTEIQQFLQADRVLVYRVWADGFGKTIAEEVVPGYVSVLHHTFPPEVFPQEFRELYSQGRIKAITDVEQAKISPCLVEFVQQFGVKAKLVVPIILHRELWGLLIAHQCSSPRKWSSFETELLQQIADQIGIALAQSALLEQEIRQRQELARSNAELEQFASIASHDLQEPLRKILAFGDRLQEKYGDVLAIQGRDYLERMQSAAKRMQALIDDLLVLSRVNKNALSLVPVNLDRVVAEVLSDLEFRIQETGGRVEVGKLSTIVADPIQIHQLLQNLISNALKFHGEASPAVKISAQRLLAREQQQNSFSPNHDIYQISIEDNGIGFEEKYLDRIFNVFQRLHSRSAYEGTGIGLAICRKIVENHGGSITANSRPGKGTTFIVMLPIKGGEEAKGEE